MPGPTLYEYADTILKGRLAEELLRRRDSGEAYQRIARWLFSDFGIDVSYETVRRWVNELDHKQPNGKRQRAS